MHKSEMHVFEQKPIGENHDRLSFDALRLSGKEMVGEETRGKEMLRIYGGGRKEADTYKNNLTPEDLAELVKFRALEQRYTREKKADRTLESPTQRARRDCPKGHEISNQYKALMARKDEIGEGSKRDERFDEASHDEASHNQRLKELGRELAREGSKAPRD